MFMYFSKATQLCGCRCNIGACQISLGCIFLSEDEEGGEKNKRADRVSKRVIIMMDYEI